MPAIEQDWVARVASPENRAAGNVDLYLTDLISGAQASITPCGVALKVTMPGGHVVHAGNHLEAWAIVEAEALDAFNGEIRHA